MDENVDAFEVVVIGAGAGLSRCMLLAYLYVAACLQGAAYKATIPPRAASRLVAGTNQHQFPSNTPLMPSLQVFLNSQQLRGHQQTYKNLFGTCTSGKLKSQVQIFESSLLFVLDKL
jgi:hypothetical protein